MKEGAMSDNGNTNNRIAMLFAHFANANVICAFCQIQRGAEAGLRKGVIKQKNFSSKGHLKTKRLLQT